MPESSFSRLERQGHRRRQELVAALRAMPAAIVILVSLIGLGRARSNQYDGDVRRHYLRQLKQATEQDDWKLAELYSKKLSALDPNDSAARYHLAWAVAAQGNHRRAVRLMQSIAPNDQYGFASAHWWLATHPAMPQNGQSKEILKEQHWHVTQFLRSNPGHIDARVLLAKTEAGLGHHRVAVEHLRQVVTEKPELHLVLARLSGHLGNNDAVTKHARLAVEAFEARLHRNPEEVETKLHLADAHALLKEPEAAARVLEAGLQHTDDPQLRAGLVRLCLHSTDLLAAHLSPAETLEQRLKLVERALTLAPGNRGVLKRLAKIVVETEDTSSRAAELLQEYLASGTAPAVVHMILGTHALAEQDTTTATLHFETAHRLQPEFAACMNNLAWSLAHGHPPQLLRAAQLAENALALAPGRPEFHETRGQILLLQGRHREALPDLERGLQSDGDISVTHASLAEVYEVLGQRELAEKHRQKGENAGRRRRKSHSSH